ncbi:hypothetical protein B4U79_15052 [Dinothrombium tinctorium]|uniref:non-specific serine/threonine protein kinase n=1 Tax=Dinothrombium tinctorium TaxID=1965070 RepID=A0A443R4A0_9ACAR|nr:hypothetical protein B4U79_15052 [Dinothrombium tinctorium]
MSDDSPVVWSLRFQGAESRIWFGHFLGMPAVRKERFVKTYRNHVLDERLTKERIRAEVRALVKIKTKCNLLGPLLPTILFVGERDVVIKDLMPVKPLHDYLDSLDANENKMWLLKLIGVVIGKIHDCGVIHGDITTSNLLVDENRNVIPIDFGLSSFSTKSEDRAVDLYVFERSLQTTTVLDSNAFSEILNHYSREMQRQGAEVLKKLEQVRLRGRKRDMVG